MNLRSIPFCCLLCLTHVLFAQDYIESFELFTTPNGLEPLQCWYGVGQSPDGMIYVVGCDHKTNSALYQFNPESKILKLCGDAVSAASAANNLHPGETFEKFHCRPEYLEGKVYVASADYSNFDDGYLEKRGFHWFAYDVIADTFLDVSAVEASGVAAQHTQAVQILADTARKTIYAMGLPTAHIYELDVTTGLTKDHGRPPFGFPDEYPAMTTYPWIGKDGRLYFTLDHMSLDSIYNQVFYLDPDSGYGVMPEWNMTVGKWNPGAFTQHGTPWRLKIGAWTKNRERCYIATNFGDIHVYDAIRHTWEYAGTLNWGDYFEYEWEAESYQMYTRTMHLNEDESKLYFVNDKRGALPGYFIIEFDLETKKSSVIVKLRDLDTEFRDRNVHGGNDIWDEEGYFYFVSFGGDKNVMLTRFNPELYRQTTSTGNLPASKLRKGFALHQNRPNPFHTETIIEYHLTIPSKVDLIVHDIAGRVSARLVSGYRVTGKHEVKWQLNNLPAGIYFYELRARNPQKSGETYFHQVKKLIVQD
jgi:hypothetical protein